MHFFPKNTARPDNISRRVIVPISMTRCDALWTRAVDAKEPEARDIPGLPAMLASLSGWLWRVRVIGPAVLSLSLTTDKVLPLESLRAARDHSDRERRDLGVQEREVLRIFRVGSVSEHFEVPGRPAL